MSSPEPFPYISEFVPPEDQIRMWHNIITRDYAIPRVIIVNDPIPSLPKGLELKFSAFPGSPPQTIAILVDPAAYEDVDKLTDVFSDAVRMSAHVDSCPSPFDFYQNNYSAVVFKAKDLATSDRPFRYYLREAVYQLAPKECTTFKISITKAVLKMFRAKKVLDPSAGWGDRLLGAAAAGVDTYHGVDPNRQLRQPYDRILEFLRGRGVGLTPNTFNVLTADFLQAEIQTEGYDTVFTSPPFWNYEVYDDGPEQSIYGKKNLDQWLTEFFFPYLKKAWSALIPGGRLILYISDTKTGEYTQRMINYINQNLNGRYLGVIGSGNNPDRLWPIWVWQK